MISGCATYRAGVALLDSDTPVGAIASLRQGNGRTAWIGLSDPVREEIERLATILGLSAEAVEVLSDLSTTRSAVRIRDRETILTIGTARYDHGRALVDLGALHLYLREGLVVSVARHTDARTRDLRSHLPQGGPALASGVAGIVHAHLEAVLVGYAQVLRDLRDDVEGLEREVFDDLSTAGASQRIYRLKREAIDFEQATAALLDPLDDVVDGMVPILGGVATSEWAGSRDRLQRLVDRAEGLDELLTGVLAAYQTEVALRQNEDMRRISAWVAIAAVPTLLAGIYGMNFEVMPELHVRYGYPIFMGVVAVVSVSLYLLFRSKKWL